MPKSKINQILFLFFLILNFFSLIFCERKDADITKAMSCMNLIIQKSDGEKLDAHTYSSKLLKCFITITEEEAKEYLVGLEQGMKTFDSEEVERLTDTSTLSTIPKDELKNYSLSLEQAIEDFKKLQEKYIERNQGKTSSNDEDDEKFRHPSMGNSLGAFMKKLTGALKLINNMGTIMIILIFAYFFSILFKKYCKNDKKKYTKNKDKDKDKSKEKNKKGKKKNE